MPIYEYRCLNGHRFEVMQRFSDPPIASCDECGSTVQKVLTAPAIHFKGSGFHNTDYGRGKTGGRDGDGDGKTATGGTSGDSGGTTAPAPSSTGSGSGSGSDSS